MGNRKVRLYRSVKKVSGAWSLQPIEDRELKNLQDLPQGAGNYYLSYYDPKRRMPAAGCFADAAKQALARKKHELENLSLGLPVLSDPEPKSEGSLTEAVTKFLSQQQAMVGNDGYEAASKSIRAYTSRLEFYKQFCASKRVTTTEKLRDTDHLWEYVAWLREQRRFTGIGKERQRKGEKFSDRYVHNIVSTLGTFARPE